MAFPAVGEFVRDDEFQLAVVGGLEEGVPDDDPSCRAESGDVGVRLDGAAACVGDEHVPDRYAGLFGEFAELVCEVRVCEGLEAVEERLEQQRREKGEHEQD